MKIFSHKSNLNLLRLPCALNLVLKTHLHPTKLIEDQKEQEFICYLLEEHQIHPSR